MILVTKQLWTPPSNFEATRERVFAAVDDLLSGADHEALDIALATVLANRMGGDAVAVFLVAPPSSSKTEIVLACSELPDTYWLSTITSHTLASGLSTKVTGGSETSLLLKLKQEGRTTLLLKEFGSVLSMPSKDRHELIGQLREVLDGQYRKTHGSGREVKWEGTLGMLAAVTGVIEEHWATVQKIGDRWLFVRVEASTERLDIAMAAIDNTSDVVAKRTRLREAVSHLMLQCGRPEVEAVAISQDSKRAIAVCANFLARARTPVSRNGYSKEVRSVPEAEGPARLSRALVKLVSALAMVRGHGEVGAAEIATVLRIVDDSLPSVRRRILAMLPDGPLSVEKLTAAVKLPTATVRSHVEDLEMLGIVEGVSKAGGKAGRPAEYFAIAKDGLELGLYWQLRANAEMGMYLLKVGGVSMSN